MPSLTRILYYLPIFVFLWMTVGAGAIFTPDVGRRDPRGMAIALSFWGMIASEQAAVTPPSWARAIGVVGLVAAFALFNWAGLSIRGHVFSYAGNNDLPQFVHSSGPYRYVRNPFYASYLLAEIGTAILWPSGWGAAVVLGMIAYFNWLARFEERKFANSPVADQYARYKAQTGRLIPRLRT